MKTKPKSRKQMQEYRKREPGRKATDEGSGDPSGAKQAGQEQEQEQEQEHQQERVPVQEADDGGGLQSGTTFMLLWFGTPLLLLLVLGLLRMQCVGPQ